MPQNNLFYPCSLYNKILNDSGGNSSYRKGHLLHKKKLLEICASQNLHIHLQVHLGDKRFCLFHVNTFFHQFTVNKQEKLQTNSSVYSNNTRNKCHLYRPIANLACSQNSTYCAEMKIFKAYHPDPKVW